MAPPPTPLQCAIFDRYDQNESWSILSARHNLNECALRRAYKRWSLVPTNRQPLQPADIHCPAAKSGRPCSFLPEEEVALKEAIEYFAENNTPLTKQGVADLVEHFIGLLPPHRSKDINFKNNRPSAQWLKSFTSRHDLAVKTVQCIENPRVEAMNSRNVAEHIARIGAAIKRFNIKDGKRIFNMDQSGISFDKMVGKSLRKVIAKRGQKPVQIAVKTRGNLDRVTVMPVVSASGATFTPVIVFPGVKSHFKRVNGFVQTVIDFLPSCYFYQREVPGVDSDIVYDWAQKFVRETTTLRTNSQYLLLVIDGYGAHITFKTLNLFKENRIITIAMPAHTSHRLQPLDVSVFSSYKSYMQREIHRMSRTKRVLDGFDVAKCIRNAYTASHNSSNIIDGFMRTGIWNSETLSPSVEPLKSYITKASETNAETPVTVETLLSSFLKQERSLLRDADVQEAGTVKVRTTSGCHLTSDSVIDALLKRENKKKASSLLKKKMAEKRDYKEKASDVTRLLELAPEREIRRQHLKESRAERIFQQKLRVKSRLTAIYGSSQGPEGLGCDAQDL